MQKITLIVTKEGNNYCVDSFTPPNAMHTFYLSWAVDAESPRYHIARDNHTGWTVKGESTNLPMATGFLLSEANFQLVSATISSFNKTFVDPSMKDKIIVE